MKKLTLFYLETCPYCQNVKKAVQELRAEDPAFGAVEIDWVEESREPDRAERYDYYYVPAIFDGDTKLYEASPLHGYAAIKSHIREALEAAGA